MLARAGSGGVAAAVVRGDPGCGKTALLEALAARARTDGWRTLSVRGIESETALAGAGLLGAVTPIRAHLASVPERQASALAAATGWEASDRQGDRFLVGAATLSLLSAAAAAEPVLLVVDDVQWVDAESTEAILFAVRRLGHDRVALVLAHRLGTTPPVVLDDLDVVPLAGLSRDEARALLSPTIAPTVVDDLVSRTGGNPLALLECRRALTASQRAGAAPLPRTLPVPDRLSSVYTDLLDGLSPGGRRLAVLCAASRDELAAPVLTALTEEGHAADECLAEVAGVLTVEDSQLSFRHPLIRSAAWRGASPAERRSAHLALAAVTVDPTGQVWHRAEAADGYDEEVAGQLAAVADEDRHRYGYAAAAAAMERAARLTSSPERRVAWLTAATEDAYVAGDAARARQLADQVLAPGTDPAARARVLLVLGLLEQFHGTFAQARELLQQAADLAEGRVLVRTLTELFHTCHLLDDVAGMSAAADRVAAVADRVDPEQAMLACYLPGAARVVEGRPNLGAPLLHDAIGILESDPVLRDDPRQLMVSLLCARWLLDPTVALGYADRRIGRARDLGALGVLASGLSLLASGLAWLGDHVRAHAAAGEAVELLDALDYGSDVGVAAEMAAVECAARGLHDEARALLDRARRNVVVSGFDPMPPHLADAVSFCAISRGDLAETVEVLEDQVERFGGVGRLLEPLGVAPLLVEAYLGLGRDEDARLMTSRFAAAQPEPCHPLVASMVARCEGMVADDVDEAAAAFERSLTLHRTYPAERFELARTELLYGMRLRRAGRRVEARARLHAARRAFAEMDLSLWEQRAAHEVAGTGERTTARAATREPLTSQETRVALLVADGLTNREVAATLFLSPKTVEHHVGAVLRKRGLRSRTELARTLAADPEGPSG